MLLKVRTELRNYALAKLSKRECSRLELKRALLKRSKKALAVALEEDLGGDGVIDPSLDLSLFKSLIGVEIESLIQGFVDLGYLSDDRYLKMAFRAQLSKAKGFRAVQMKMREKGIALSEEKYRELLAQELGDVDGSGDPDLARMREFLDRKNYDLTDPKEKNKAFQGLMRRGFSVSQIQRVLRELKT